VVIVAAAWMLDPAACTGMALGAPRVTVSALVELHRLLVERGFRRSSPDDPTIVQEEQDEKPAETGAAIRGAAPAHHGAARRPGALPRQQQRDGVPERRPSRAGRLSHRFCRALR
jgi:hypothetical protein